MQIFLKKLVRKSEIPVIIYFALSILVIALGLNMTADPIGISAFHPIEALAQGDTGWTEENGMLFWYEDGIKQGVDENDGSYRGKEINPFSVTGDDNWYWLDSIQGGAVAVSKDVYQESSAGLWADHVVVTGNEIDPNASTGKWVRYDAEGHMIKGWSTGYGESAARVSYEEAMSAYASGEPVYYFDVVYGTMAKGIVTIDGIEYRFDDVSGTLAEVLSSVGNYTGWLSDADGNKYWYENGIRQGVSVDLTYRGKEIYDPASNAWYWLDNTENGIQVYGKMAVSKDVYQDSLAGDWGDSVNANGEKTGKWVRYDADGHMVKGWQTAEDGSTFYFDPVYGSMAKGTVILDGVQHEFDAVTGILIIPVQHKLEVSNILQNPELPTGCEITALAMVLNYFGYEADKVDLAQNYLPMGPAGVTDFHTAFVGEPWSTSGLGCYAPAIVTAAEGYLSEKNSSLKVTDLTGTDFQNLFSYINQGIPVIVWPTFDMEEPTLLGGWVVNGNWIQWIKGEHCMVLTGYDLEQGIVYVSDPLRGNTTYDMALFMKRYQQMGSQAVILTPKASAAEE